MRQLKLRAYVGVTPDHAIPRFPRAVNRGSHATFDCQLIASVDDERPDERRTCKCHGVKRDSESE